MNQNKDELYHYGVPGMRWGKRKAVSVSSGSIMDRVKKQHSKIGASKSAVKSAKNKYNKTYDSYFEGHGVSGADVDRTRSKMKSAKKQLKADKKTAKQLRKDFIKAKSKEIRKGQSLLGKMYGDLTGSRKIQAEMDYDRDMSKLRKKRKK